MQLFALLEFHLARPPLPCPLGIPGGLVVEMVVIGEDVDLLLDWDAGEGLVEGAEGRIFLRH